MINLFDWKKKISTKLTIIYAVMFILVILLLNGAAYFGLRYFIINSAHSNLDKTMEFILNRINSSYELYETDIIEEISQTEQNIYFRILSPQENILGQSTLLKDQTLPLKPGYNDLVIDNRPFIYRSSFILKRGNFIGYLQGVREMTLEYRFLRALLTVMIATSIVGILGAVLTGYMITKKTLEPLSRMTKTVRNISFNDLGKRLELTGPEDELYHLADTFNSMLDRLEDSFKKQQQFISDASHELRTPISVIRGYINLLDRWGKNEEEVRDEAIEAIKNEAGNMQSLTEGLLFLARSDSDQLEIKKDYFPWKELIDELLKETEMISDDLLIESNHTPELEFYGDRKLIKQMLRIFIDNSIKYTPAGGEIRINSVLTGDGVKVSIADTGIGIAEEDIPYIFERFYRADKSRSEEKGLGLGLSIAKWIIEEHQGEVVINSKPGQGTSVEVFLPNKGENTI
ncbi:MAG: HAMP domain-containing protein [Firmicutes bacterium]|nr:HAMP domain-containing protein [Bacillota bacterium]